jgi:hypothetical protein
MVLANPTNERLLAGILSQQGLHPAPLLTSCDQRVVRGHSHSVDVFVVTGHRRTHTQHGHSVSADRQGLRRDACVYVRVCMCLTRLQCVYDVS